MMNPLNPSEADVDAAIEKMLAKESVRFTFFSDGAIGIERSAYIKADDPFGVIVQLIHNKDGENA